MSGAAWNGVGDTCPRWLLNSLEKSAKDAMPCEMSEGECEWDGYMADHYAEATCVLPKTPFEGATSADARHLT